MLEVERTGLHGGTAIGSGRNGREAYGFAAIGGDTSFYDRRGWSTFVRRRESTRRVFRVVLATVICLEWLDYGAGRRVSRILVGALRDLVAVAGRASVSAVKLVLLDALLLLHPPILEPDLHLRPESQRNSFNCN